MRRGGVQIFLAIVISFLIPIPSAYPYYRNLIEPNFHCADLSFENPDADDVIIDHRALHVLGGSSISNSPIPFVNPHNEPFRFFSEMAFLYHDTSVLRC
jgi:hypothetical protein